VRRHATTAGLAVVTASLVLAGCSSTEQGTAVAAPSSASSGPFSSSAGASSDVTAWAASFCSAAKPIADATASMSRPSAATMSTPDGAKAYIVGTYTTFARAFTATATAVSALGAPPVAGAGDFVPKAVTAFTTAGRTFQDLATTASTVDLTDPNALETLTGGLTTMTDPFQGAFTELESSTPAELDAALSSAPECAALSR
jgi:hypothetical protein